MRVAPSLCTQLGRQANGRLLLSSRTSDAGARAAQPSRKNAGARLACRRAGRQRGSPGGDRSGALDLRRRQLSAARNGAGRARERAACLSDARQRNAERRRRAISRRWRRGGKLSAGPSVSSMCSMGAIPMPLLRRGRNGQGRRRRDAPSPTGSSLKAGAGKRRPRVRPYLTAYLLRLGRCPTVDA